MGLWETQKRGFKQMQLNALEEKAEKERAKAGKTFRRPAPT